MVLLIQLCVMLLPQHSFIFKSTEVSSEQTDGLQSAPATSDALNLRYKV